MLLNNISFASLTGSSFDDPRSFDDPIVDDLFLQSSEKKVSDDVVDENEDGSEDDSDEDDDDHSHAKKTQGILFYIFLNYLFCKNSRHIAVKKDFPLDMKIKREDKRSSEDAFSVVASDVKERSQPSFLNNGKSGILPLVSIIKHEKGYLAFYFLLYFFNGIHTGISWYPQGGY